MDIMKRIVTPVIALLIALSLTSCNKPAAPEVDSPLSTAPAFATPAATDAEPAVTDTATSLPDNTQETVTFQFTTDNMPLIDGSTATIPLIGAVYSVLLGLPRDQADAMTSISGTDDAYYNLINGTADVLLVYGPSPDSLSWADSRGVKLDMVPIGRDGLVFLVNKLNPVTSLTPEQLVSIYSGAITNWKEVGGHDVTIRAFQRQRLSGSQTMMDSLVMKGVPMANAPMEYVIAAMHELVTAIASYNNAESAIGYNVYYFVSQMNPDPNVKLLQVSGVAPSAASISDGTYPFVADFYAVIRDDEPAGSPARILYNWIQSINGQNLVKNEGYATR